MKQRIARLVARLELIATALAATMATLPERSVAPLREVLDAVVPAASTALAAAHGLSTTEAALCESRMRDLHDASPPVPFLPILDARPA